MTTRSRRIAWLAVGLWLVMAAPAFAQTPPVTVTTPAGDVAVIADRIEQIGPERLVVATGNVEITRGGARLTADRVEINRDTGDAVATGNVIFYEGEVRFSARRMDYNFRTGTGVIHDVDARAAPYYRVSGERLERIDEDVYRVQRAVFSTCEADPPAWSVRMREATADFDSFVWGTGASFWVRSIPLIPWVPFFAAPIRRERQTGFLFPKLGTSSRKGFAAEIPFFWAISDSQDMTLALLGYERVGLGLNGEYRYVLSNQQRGSLRAFVLEESERNGADRGWAAVRHDWAIARDFTFTLDVKRVSDDRVLADYGDTLRERGEQRLNSNVFLTRHWEASSAIANVFWYQDLTTRRPIELNRLPELSLQRVRHPVPGVDGALWELDAGAVRFVRDVGGDGSRVDLHPRVSRPVSVLGVTTVTPFVGGRLTGYDRRVVAVRTGADGGPLERTVEDVRLRRLFEIGSDVETVASRAYPVGGWQDVDAILHLVEPRLRYTRVDGETLRRLPSWTDIERVGEANVLEYSLTNRVRARTVATAASESQTYEPVRLLLGHSLDLRHRAQTSGDLVADLLLRTPADRLSVRGALRHGTHGEGVQTGDADVTVVLPRATTSVGTRYSRVTRTSFLEGTVNADITRLVTGRLSTNFDMRTSTVVENRLAVDIRFQCWSITVELIDRSRRVGRGGEDEIRVAVNLLGIGGPIGTSMGLGTGAGVAGR